MCEDAAAAAAAAAAVITKRVLVETGEGSRNFVPRFLEIFSTDSPETAASRFCIDNPCAAAVEDSIASVAADLLKEHGFTWDYRSDATLLGTKPRLQWLRQTVGCPTRVIDAGAHEGIWTQAGLVNTSYLGEWLLLILYAFFARNSLRCARNQTSLWYATVCQRKHELAWYVMLS
jgi:hypothetical protein